MVLLFPINLSIGSTLAKKVSDYLTNLHFGAKNRFSDIPFVYIFAFLLNIKRLLLHFEIDWRLKPGILTQGTLNVNEKHHSYY